MAAEIDSAHYSSVIVEVLHTRELKKISILYQRVAHSVEIDFAHQKIALLLVH